MGNPLQAGELIFTGALGALVPVIAGDHVEVATDGLGKVSVFFEE